MLSAHHVRAIVGTAAAGAAAIATVVALVLRRRRGAHPRTSVIVLLATTVATAGGLMWTGLAGGRINHPELQVPDDRAGGPALPH